MQGHAAQMKRDHGEVVACRWLAANCSPDSCVRREFEGHPAAERVTQMIELLGVCDDFPAMQPALLGGCDVRGLRDLQTVRAALRAEREGSHLKRR